MFHSRTAVNLCIEPARPATLITEQWANQDPERPRCITTVNALAVKQHDGRQWREGLASVTIVEHWKKNLRASEFLDFVSRRPSNFAWQKTSL